MGKSKGGSSGGKAPVAPTNPGFNLYNASVFQPLGTYGAENLQGLGSLSNWAANIATGGNVQTGGTMPFNGLLPGGGTQFFAPFTSTGTSTAGGQNLGALAGVNSQSLGPFLSQAVGDLLQAQGTTPILQELLKSLNRQYTQEGQQAAGYVAQGTDQLKYGGTLLAGGQNIINQGQGIIGQGENMLAQATTGTGLYPSQQAMIDQAVQTQQAQITQQLSSEGLNRSTLLPSLLGQASIAGAAAAGQLVQGNIQLAQTQIGLGQQQIGLGEQEQQVGISEQGVGLASEQLSQTEQQLMQDTQQLKLGAQAALYTQFATISQLSSGLQGQIYQQAMEGYGAMGQMYNNVLNSFGYGLKTTEDVQQSQQFNAGLQLNEQQLQAQASAAESQGFSNMLGGLGQLLGGQGGLLGGAGGAAGGLLGGGSGGLLGGLFGTSAAGASGALTGGLGGSIGDIIGILASVIGAF